MEKQVNKLIFITLIMAGSLTGLSQTVVTLNVEQPEQLQANAGQDTTICINRSIVLSGEAIGGKFFYLYLWSPAESLDNPTTQNPIANPDTTTTYVLTVIDSDNCTASSEVTVYVDACTGINIIDKTDNLILYPNPNDGSFYIEASPLYSGEIIEIRVLNVYGQIIYHNRLRPGLVKFPVEVNIPDMIKGIYILQLKSMNNVETRRFSVM